MSLLLAPYNDSMRLGMGFNSYTQTCCVNDAVQRFGGIKATETDLRDVTKSEKPSNATGSKEIALMPGEILQNASGNTVIEKIEDGQTRVSQLVSWEAKFVNKISEITDSMNISGSLAIKVDAIGGGGEASGHFIDSNKFKESDLNYHIQVKVTNQKLIAEDMTEFCPIRNVTPGQFTDVYGDSFISGFLEGGVFNALVSMKFEDKAVLKDFGGRIKVEMDVKTAKASAEFKGKKVNKDTNTNHTSTISVSWSGGGDIKPDGIKDWTMETLKQVAMEFPDRVAHCPQRTSAILTKYTALRSYYEQSVKGTPLDYENAGIYASALLDSYMDYKSIWKQVQSATWEVDNGISRLLERDQTDDLKAYGAVIQEDYARRLGEYEVTSKALVAVSKASSADARAVDKPLQPNKVVVYRPSLFGLDSARRDCRFEMIKIVQEVDAVMSNPKVAVDPNRGWQYLSPVIFRQLIPNVKNMNEEKNAEDLKALQEENTRYKTRVTNAEAELAKITTERDAAKQDLEAAKAVVPKDSAVSGVTNAIAGGWRSGVNTSALVLQNFAKPFANIPRVIYGLKILDAERSGNWGLQSAMKDITRTGMTFEFESVNNCQGWAMEMSWLTLPDNDIHFEHGVFDTITANNSPTNGSYCPFTFTTPYSTPPKVVCWIYGIQKDNIGWFSLRTYAKDITNSGFTIVVESWCDRPFRGAKVGWLAYDANEDGKRVRSSVGDTAMRTDRTRSFSEHWYGGSFQSTPATFIAFNELDYGMGSNLRAKANIDGVSKDTLQWSFGTWGDSDMDHCKVTWIGIEP